ncbi:uncharacterized protein LOC133795434 [Humulus lupulus]|uniref:uncharacterized protein LOC133795434 n=1 Tax=Humulus lupulus TaxID=3486 RepID=UPI002B40BBE0|nr:uncharacterized protein LOC133795434 [Humulus lupulus]
MAETKRKTRDGGSRKNNKKPKKAAEKEKTKRRGPRIPSSFRKELDRINPKTGSPVNSDDDERIDSEEGEVYGNDVYEYEERVPEEESKKNRRFDRVENFDYELPHDFEDEDVSSDDDKEMDNDKDVSGSDEDEDNGDEKHMRMLQGITGMPGETFDGKKKNKKYTVITEAYPESEYNPTRDVLDGHGQISVEDLLDPLYGKSGYNQLRKRVHQLEKKSTTTQAPLPKAERERLERKAAYEHSKKDLLKWEPLVKRNREAPTLFFGNDVDLGFSTVGAIASEFEPRTEFEKKIASLVHDDKVMDAHSNDGSRLLEFNKVSVEDEKERQNRIAKMRSLLFRHELKAKHIKKIKSKTFHRLLKKDKLKAASSESVMDPEASKDMARKHEYDRAKERMTLRHKNSSKWAKRIKERGLDAQDEGTRAAVAEQQHLHALLTRKMNSMKEGSSSSSDESSDEAESDEDAPGLEQGKTSKLLKEAKEKTINVLNEEDEVPNSGLLSLPFMVRGMNKRNEAAAEEAKLALEDFDSLSKQLEGSGGAEDIKIAPTSGRMVFSAAGKQAAKASKTKLDKKSKSDRFYDDSDSENDLEAEDDDSNGINESTDLHKEVNIDPNVLHEVSGARQNALFKSFDDVVGDPGPKTTHEVAIFASGTWKKMKGKNNDASSKKSQVSVEPVLNKQDVQETVNELGEDSDSESDGQMVDGILSSGPKPYELPSQAELIHQAFAADDVEDDFEKHKQMILNEENPEPEKPVLLPGWGQWTDVQNKKGLPSWMLKEHETAKRKREEAVKKRKDAQLKHVIISEKVDKKAEKLYTKSLPFPYTSKEVFEQSIRMPIGPEFNPATAVGALNRPEVMKKPGQIIKPIEYEDVDPYEKGGEQQKRSGQKQKQNNKQKQKQKSSKKSKS